LAYHAVLLCVLFSWALIKLDGYRLPRRYVLLIALWGFALPLGVPAVHPVPWADPRPAWIGPSWGDGRLDTSLIGALAGAALGWGILLAQQRGGRHIPTRLGDRFDGAAALGVVGLHLGWQAAVSVALLATTLQLLANLGSAGRLSRQHAAFFGYLVIAAAWQIIGWCSLDCLAGWPSSRCGIWQAVVFVLPCVLQAYVAGYLDRSPSFPTGEHQENAAQAELPNR
jgi:prepilin signal peptidase PulO-like enzyme (type II secretory pathway)